MSSETNSASLDAVPGVVIDHLPQESGQYIGSPSLAILPGGVYVASHDAFGPGTTEHESGVTTLFASRDRGETWSRLTELRDLFWAGLFVHRGVLYIFGITRHHGLPVIRRSDDEGATWTEPTDERTGLLAASGEYHTAPVPVICRGGRIWRAIEDASNGTNWGERYSPMVISAPEDADLLRRESWTFSNALPHQRAWLGAQFGGWLEGNVVVAPDGRVVNILRVDHDPGNVAAIVDVSPDGREIAFEPASFIRLPGAATKFTIRHDLQSGSYWTLANIVGQGVDAAKATHVRNRLALARSSDLREWEVRTVLIQRDDHRRYGFQYADWLFDGDDIVAAVRTAHDDGGSGAHSPHDANFLTFHRFRGFRTAVDRPGESR